MRVRENVLWYKILDRRPFVETLRQHIPSGALTVGTPWYFVEAQQAGLDYIGLPWFHWEDPGLVAAVPSNAWVVISEGYRTSLDRADVRWRANRPHGIRHYLFCGSRYTQETCYIYAPASGAVKPAAVEEKAAVMEVSP
jgi:hypothetical protein